ncbi:hypothetical protein [Vibrio europaeus]|uniref:Phage protein n=1 Tax=Vibrio europaeus TaxID=300876 RepID=A0A178JAU1_9VIBR|nr:hypothetical protein [Vibrio europaeus]MDC5702975.1 hypothetical protein [Vibrio europaeus]MDC5708793.1 hypothetical protein [Vibrio europaeus]MDC5712867.1 hypothetical protein [Vibrio europaeus]MDC5725287.1 hypothetical protein [Vibrio europaeus]MDC5731849.1 hypothetical protein [Vibrio europaeus]
MHQVCEALTLIQNTNDKIHVLADALSAWDSEKVELTDEHISTIGNILYGYCQDIERTAQKIKDRSK